MTTKELQAAFFAANPDYREIAERALEFEDQHSADQYYGGWSWSDVRAMPPRLVKLVTEGIVGVRYRSRRYTNYELIDRETTRRALQT